MPFRYTERAGHGRVYRVDTGEFEWLPGEELHSHPQDDKLLSEFRTWLTAAVAVRTVAPRPTRARPRRSFSVRHIRALLRKPYEICGEVRTLLGHDVFDFAQRGNTQGRRQCSAPAYPVIWHTHPNRSKAYPSVEDINKVVKHSTTRSLIFTAHGVWELHCAGKHTELAGSADGAIEACNTWFYGLVYRSADRLDERTTAAFQSHREEYRRRLNAAVRPLHVSVFFRTYDNLAARPVSPNIHRA